MVGVVVNGVVVATERDEWPVDIEEQQRPVSGFHGEAG
jgi:hypothetical protein